MRTNALTVVSGISFTGKSTTPILLSLVACLFILLSSNPVLAGGGVNWKTTVTNNTSSGAEVRVYFGLGGKNSYHRFGPNSSYTFEFGADCPTKLSGYVGDHLMVETDIFGGLPACFNTSYTICPFSGAINTFTFCKN